jgi:hypothetical protein
VVKPRLVQDHEGVPASGFACARYPQKGLGALELYCLLMVRKDMFHRRWRAINPIFS